MKLPHLFGFFRDTRHATRIWWLRHRRGFRIGKNCKIHPTALFQATGGGTVSIGDDVEIWPGVILAPYGGSIEIGSRVYVGPHSVLYGQGGLRVGDNTLIASHVVLIPSNHNFDDPNTPIRDQGERNLGITIGQDCWIGAHATVVDGVDVGNGCVIGAGAVVTRSLPENAVAVGVPARVTGTRGKVK
jgi:acetyltransferase-like isoleucine patch superfamily enzyme